MITSKLTSKAQTTIPQPVRAALGVREGDELAYAIEDGRVVLTKLQPRHAWRAVAIRWMTRSPRFGSGIPRKTSEAFAEPLTERFRLCLTGCPSPYGMSSGLAFPYADQAHVGGSAQRW